MVAMVSRMVILAPRFDLQKTSKCLQLFLNNGLGVWDYMGQDNHRNSGKLNELILVWFLHFGESSLRIPQGYNRECGAFLPYIFLD